MRGYRFPKCLLGMENADNLGPPLTIPAVPLSFSCALSSRTYTPNWDF